jgi:hypothetical protein
MILIEMVRRNADAVVEDEHARLAFVEPYEIDEDFGDFLEYVQSDSSSASKEATHKGNVKYAQTRESHLPITMTMTQRTKRRLKQQHRKRQSPRRILGPLRRRPSRHPICNRSPRTSPRCDQFLARKSPLHHRPAQGQLREHLHTDPRPETLRPLTARGSGVCE